MITTSQKWKDWASEYGTFHIKATLFDENSNTMELSQEDFMMGSVTFTDAMSGMSEIKFGACDTNSFHATLNNFNGKFDDWVWKYIDVYFGIENPEFSAVVGDAIVGIAVVGVDTSSSNEWIFRGSYIIDRPKTTGNTINIECYDYMDLFNKAFSGLNETLTYPVQSNDLITSICTYCGISNVINSLSPFSIDTFEFDETTSCRQVLLWILETLGSYARFVPQNNTTPIVLGKWNIGGWGISDDLDGGVFDTWNDPASADGGTFNPWNTTTDYNGGAFYEGQQPYEIERLTSRTIAMDSVAITGIRAYSNDESVNDLAGTDGYIITIRNNPLVTTDNVSVVSNRAWGDVEGLDVRPFEAYIYGDPSMEAGDVVVVSDDRGNYYKSLITAMEYKLNGTTRVGCYALTPQENFNQSQ